LSTLGFAGQDEDVHELGFASRRGHSAHHTPTEARLLFWVEIARPERRMKSRELAKRHLALSRKTIMKLANCRPADEPLRQIFLSAPMIRKILGDHETTSSRTKQA
jgi:hypothetical protein